MRKRHGLVALPLAVVLAAGGVLSTGNGATAGQPTASGAADAARTVTLITGDRVTVLPGGGIRVQRGEGRDHVAMMTGTVDGHLRVIPSDALPLLAAGRLDPRLFDVAGLLAAGYDRRADLPLIVTDPAGTIRSNAVTGAVVRRLPSMNGAVVRTPKSSAGRFWSGLTGKSAADRVALGTPAKVWLDGASHPLLAESVAQIGAPVAWRAGYTGTGVTVAVLDTGVDTNHPDLAGRVAAQVDFSPVADGGAPTTGDIRDADGHGTHVASTIMGSGAASGGRYRGVAPGVRLVSGKICDGGCYDSAVIAAMEWAARDQHAKVVNISSGKPDTPGLDPIEQALDSLTAQYGTLFVVAAGNDGAGNASQGTVSSPGSADAALTVGAVDKNGRLAGFSSTGPRVGDGAVKPDLTAPGVDITAAHSADAYGDPTQRYTTMYGTSMAAPHVAGSAAILAQRHPDWTPRMLKAALIGSAAPSAGAGAFQQGAGLVDVSRAIAGNVLADPPSVSFGLQSWPHADDQPIAKPVTYRNTSAQPVTLAIGLRATGPDGAAAPDGLFRLSARRVTLPAGGTASVTVTADSRVATADGMFSATITASAGGLTVRTPMGLVREPEHHELTIRHLSRTGAPADFVWTRVVAMDTTQVFSEFVRGDTMTVRAPRGRYAILSSMPTSDDWAMMVQPELDLTGDRTVTIDARQAEPIRITVPRADATILNATVTTAVRNPRQWDVEEIIGDGGLPIFLGQVGADGPADRLVTAVRTTQTDGTDASPYAYQLAWYKRGGGFTGLTRKVTGAQLATVHNTYSSNVPGGTGALAADPVIPGVTLTPYVYPLPAPAVPTAYYYADGDISWNTQFIEASYDPEYASGTLAAPAAAYRAGRTYRADWNKPVYGPCFGSGGPYSWGVTWSSDTLQANLPLRCDQAGHAGWGDAGTGRTRLYRDGTLLREVLAAGLAKVPAVPDGGRYRLTVDATHNPAFALTRRTSVAWTFTAPPGPGPEPVRLPLSVVRLLPELDGASTAAAGTAYRIPMRVESQPGATVPANISAGLEVSYDDGDTWQAATVTGGAGSYVAQVQHPAADGFVSLRATATDGAGSTVEQTVIRAYRIAMR